MKIVVYILALLITVACIALALEFGLQQFLPDSYRGYLMPDRNGMVKWAIGPYEPSQAATGFNIPVVEKKPDNTIRIISLGTSGTEGWLSAQTVLNKYGLPPDPGSLSSYSRALEFAMNESAEPASKKIEVINLGVAAYNITDVIRMLKDSLRLDPDMFIIQIGGNETWTAERAKWSSLIDTDVPYLYTELGYEILTGIKAGWQTLSVGGNAFNPLALFSSKPQPVVLEPPGRAPGLGPRLENYSAELERLGKFLARKGIPSLFLVPSQNLADFLPFGSMAKIGTDAETLDSLNRLLIEALAAPPSESRERYMEILALDDGIAEANFQLGKIYLKENDPVKARELFWKANNRDLVLKRLPSDFHDISRKFIAQNAFIFIDEMAFFESESSDGVVGYNWLDDDVHPSRKGQFYLGREIAKTIVENELLGSIRYSADLTRLPTFEQYNQWTGFNRKSEGNLAYIKGAHNFLAFGRFRQRLLWDPEPERFLSPVLDDLKIANADASIDQALYMSTVINLYLGRSEEGASLIDSMKCDSSPERGAAVQSGMMNMAYMALGSSMAKVRKQLESELMSKGCQK